MGNVHLAGYSTTLIRLFPSPSENILREGCEVVHTGRNCGCGARTTPEAQADSQAGDAISLAALSLPGTRTTPQAGSGRLQPLPAVPGAGRASPVLRL